MQQFLRNWSLEDGELLTLALAGPNMSVTTGTTLGERWVPTNARFPDNFKVHQNGQSLTGLWSMKVWSLCRGSRCCWQGLSLNLTGPDLSFQLLLQPPNLHMVGHSQQTMHEALAASTDARNWVQATEKTGGQPCLQTLVEVAPFRNAAAFSILRALEGPRPFPNIFCPSAANSRCKPKCAWPSLK